MRKLYKARLLSIGVAIVAPSIVALLIISGSSDILSENAIIVSARATNYPVGTTEITVIWEDDFYNTLGSAPGNIEKKTLFGWTRVELANPLDAMLFYDVFPGDEFRISFLNEGIQEKGDYRVSNFAYRSDEFNDVYKTDVDGKVIWSDRLDEFGKRVPEYSYEPVMFYCYFTISS